MDLLIRKYHLLGLFIFGFICAGFTQPIGHEPIEDEETQSDDGDYSYNDDGPTGNHTKLASGTLSTSDPPFFEHREFKQQAISGQDVTLECPVKNLKDSNFAIWYNNTNVIVTGTKVINTERVTITGNHSLIIKNINKFDNGDYQCSIHPSNITYHIRLQVLNELPAPANAQPSHVPPINVPSANKSPANEPPANEPSAKEPPANELISNSVEAEYNSPSTSLQSSLALIIVCGTVMTPLSLFTQLLRI